MKILSYAEFKQRVTVAFESLCQKGYICRQDFMCCQSCGCHAISQIEKVAGQDNPKFVFWHNKDTSGFHDETVNYKRKMRGHKRLQAMGSDSPLPKPPGLYVSWGGGNGKEIVKALNDERLVTKWDGGDGQRIWISAYWKP